MAKSKKTTIKCNAKSAYWDHGLLRYAAGPVAAYVKNTTRLMMQGTSFEVSEQYQVFLDQMFSFIIILV